MEIRCFEDIIAWQQARCLVASVYGSMKDCRDFGFKDQIQRAAVSVMNNIAEGFERKGNKEFLQFLKISKGSCAEVCSMLYLAKDLGYLSESDFVRISDQAKEVTRVLAGFIKYLRN
ncbi:four helix bundle protein [Candidatus Uhrbacteria bacterium]|nr:four helix bundle protein [Candidatus Uhrbacteria bacterium]